MSGREKDGDRGTRRKAYKENKQSQNQNSQKSGTRKKTAYSLQNQEKFEKKKGSLHERPKWVPPVPPAIKLQPQSCAWCGKPIKEIAIAISEPNTNKPVHFDCVINSISEKERLERGDTVSYIGGGRFGIVHFKNPHNTQDFRIKKIFEWENKDYRSEWREILSGHFSVT